MKVLTNVALSVVLATSLSGCVIIDRPGGEHDGNDWRHEQKENRQIISELPLNASRQEVHNKLGAPEFSEAFTKGNDEYRVLYYRTQHRHSDGDTTKDETTPLVFKNDKLIGWGQDTLARAR
ncbi:DUF3192 domain-containing protein [Aliikangiella sp. G2MR2-5]|uniref:DUF3192 domain-containing protein n=1 Tax=Aliikangiella sp. G2MR2-5 TaxID=2788943 RepID=UPI0018AACE51|nr:DUF3192 domain-containing protein [Aliikangiella sp. G2MR2-5]